MGKVELTIHCDSMEEMKYVKHAANMARGQWRKMHENDKEAECFFVEQSLFKIGGLGYNGTVVSKKVAEDYVKNFKSDFEYNGDGICIAEVFIKDEMVVAKIAIKNESIAGDMVRNGCAYDASYMFDPKMRKSVPNNNGDRWEIDNETKKP